MPDQRRHGDRLTVPPAGRNRSAAWRKTQSISSFSKAAGEVPSILAGREQSKVRRVPVLSHLPDEYRHSNTVVIAGVY